MYKHLECARKHCKQLLCPRDTQLQQAKHFHGINLADNSTKLTHVSFVQVPGGPQPAQPPFKLNIVESIERIKEEFNFLQAQYHK